jgi:hypothetical protein
MYADSFCGCPGCLALLYNGGLTLCLQECQLLSECQLLAQACGHGFGSYQCRAGFLAAVRRFRLCINSGSTEKCHSEWRTTWESSHRRNPRGSSWPCEHAAIVHQTASSPCCAPTVTCVHQVSSLATGGLPVPAMTLYMLMGSNNQTESNFTMQITGDYNCKGFCCFFGLAAASGHIACVSPPRPHQHSLLHRH